MAMHCHVWSCIGISSCMVMHGHGYIWPSVVMHGLVMSGIFMYGVLWLYMVVNDYNLRSCMDNYARYGHVLACMMYG